MKWVREPGSLTDLDAALLAEADAIEDLLAFHRNQVLCPIYTSVDIRENRHKAAVIDTNAFPAGFNNLAARSHADATDVIKKYMARVYPAARQLLLVGESHTRNTWYLENLAVLRDLFVDAGFAVTVGTLNEDLWPVSTLQTAKGRALTLHAVLRDGDALIADGIVHDVIILNNDLSGGSPDLLDGIDQPVTPPPAMGWHRRRKSEHFRIANELAAQVGKAAGFDPWLMSAEFACIEGVDFGARRGLEDVAGAVDKVLARVAHKHDEYGIGREPHVFVKADAGTYGMGVMVARSGEEFLNLNRKARDKMRRGKEGVETEAVIIQEGVATDLALDTGGAAEPVMYLVCGRVVGGFHRVHAARGSEENLNAPGSTFDPIAFVTHGDGAPPPDETVLDPVSQHVFQSLGEVASIATGYELRFADRPGAALPTYR